MINVSLDKGTEMSSSVGPSQGAKDGNLDGLLDVISLLLEYQTTVDSLDDILYGFTLYRKLC